MSNVSEEELDNKEPRLPLTPGICDLELARNRLANQVQTADSQAKMVGGDQPAFKVAGGCEPQ